MNLSAYLVLLSGIALSSTGQILLKQGMSRHPNFRVQEILRLARDGAIITGFGCYGISTLLYFKVLSDLGLSVAYPTISLGYVLVVIISRFFFKEAVSHARWAALGMICVGVALVGLGNG